MAIGKYWNLRKISGHVSKRSSVDSYTHFQWLSPFMPITDSLTLANYFPSLDAKHSNFQFHDLNFAEQYMDCTRGWTGCQLQCIDTYLAVQQSSIAYPGQRKCIQYPYRDVGWWKRGNPVISPYSAFYYWSRTSCVIWRRSDTLSVWQCVLYVSAAISVVPVKAYVSPALSPYCLRYVLFCATSISTQLYVHAPVSAPLMCMWHCRYLYTSASVHQ
jgi:hypothetical protein